MKIKDRDHAREVLSGDDGISYHVWYFTSYGMGCCEPGCCDDTYDSIDEALDSLESYCGGKWEECRAY